MTQASNEILLGDAIQRVAYPLETDSDLDPLLARTQGARYVLLGEASHGTSEYYTWRTRISQRLIQEQGFNFIAVEGDWPDCYAVNRYVRHFDDGGESAREVLHQFARWPTWMWANWEVVALAEWLHDYNRGRPPEQQVGFYGLDVYSLWESLEEITRYLEGVDPEAAETARQAYNCFQPYDRDEQAYAWATRIVPAACERDVLRLLAEIQTRRTKLQRQAGDGEAVFNAEQNAHAAVGAEHYYRTMIEGGPASWNVRDYHMADTLDRVVQHLGPGAKGILWEHNTHIGDARATDMAAAGMVNVGQIVRERHADDGVVLVGFASHRGSVIAGRAWDAPMEVMPVPEARAGSWEDLLHRSLQSNGMILMNDLGGADTLFRATRPHRAIGVVYHPDYERLGNYVPTSLTRRYDAFLFIDETQALHPLHLTEEAAVEPPETYPWNV